MKKRLLTLALAMVMVCGLLPTAAMAVTVTEIVPPKYVTVGDFSEGLVAVGIGEWAPDWGFIDKTGKEVVPPKYDDYLVPPEFHDGLAAVRLNGKWGFIDKTGKEVIPLQYDGAQRFSEGLASVKLAGKWGFIDTTGKEVVPCTLEYYGVGSYLPEGLRKVRDERYHWGFIDKTGKEVVPCKYNYAYSFHDGPAAVSLDDKWGFIDKTGKEVVPFQYDYAYSFHDGLAAVKLNDKWGFIAIEGSTDTPAAATAYASTQTVTVDGKPATFHAYALKDENGNDTNYIKLRDVAQILNGSAAQFQVGWDGSISITTKTAYTPDGSEMKQNFTGNQTYAVSTSPVTVNGLPTNLEAITLTDANGGGYTYFKLRDLGAALGFDVSWNAQTGISIDPNSPYNANN